MWWCTTFKFLLSCASSAFRPATSSSSGSESLSLGILYVEVANISFTLILAASILALFCIWNFLVSTFRFLTGLSSVVESTSISASFSKSSQVTSMLTNLSHSLGKAERLSGIEKEYTCGQSALTQCFGISICSYHAAVKL